MKLWELISAFRSEQALLDAVFAEYPDRELSDHYTNFDALVSGHDRSALDKVVPDELVSLVASRSIQTFTLSADGNLHLAQSAKDAVKGEVLSTLDVFKRFGGSVIEEIQERGSARTAG